MSIQLCLSFLALLGIYGWVGETAPLYHKEDLKTAASLVKEGILNIATASRTFCIPESTLRYAATVQTERPSTFSSSSSILTRQQERDLANYVKYMSERGFFIDTRTIAQFAQEILSLENKNWAPKDPKKWDTDCSKKNSRRTGQARHLTEVTDTLTDNPVITMQTADTDDTVTVTPTEHDLPTITHKKKATWKGKGKGKGKGGTGKLKSKATTRTDRPTLTNNDIK